MRTTSEGKGEAPRKGRSTEMVSTVNVGEKVRKLRKESGLSIQKLAEKSGVSPAGVYKIETNGMTPTITTLMKLANALEKRVSYFIEEEDHRAEVEYVPRDGRRVVLKNEMGTNERIAGVLKDAKLDGNYKVIEAGSRSGSCVSSKAGEALVYCLRGELDFEVKGKSYQLREGDVIHYKTDLPHSWQNRGLTATHILMVSTPPIEG